jgi:hypothetical protein
MLDIYRIRLPARHLMGVFSWIINLRRTSRSSCDSRFQIRNQFRDSQIFLYDCYAIGGRPTLAHLSFLWSVIIIEVMHVSERWELKWHNLMCGPEVMHGNRSRFWRALTAASNTRDYRGFEFFPSSGILQGTMFRTLDLFTSSDKGVHQWLKLALLYMHKGPGVSRPLTLGWLRSCFQKVVSFRTTDDSKVIPSVIHHHQYTLESTAGLPPQRQQFSDEFILCVSACQLWILDRCARSYIPPANLMMLSHFWIIM